MAAIRENAAGGTDALGTGERIFRRLAEASATEELRGKLEAA
jgi:hypothetical protein